MNKGSLTVLCCALMAGACGTNPRNGVESCVPADTTVLAGIDLDQARKSAVYSKLPVPQLPEASRMMLAFNGKDLLMIAQGSFRAAPAGWTLVAPGLAVSGSETAVRAATAQHNGPAAKPAVLTEAERVTGGKPVWGVAHGGVSLPLSGNGGNLNPLLAKSEYAYFTMALSPQVEAELTFVGQTDDAAVYVERTLRGFLQFARMGEKRDPQAKAILEAVNIDRKQRNVEVSVRVSPEDFNKLVDSLTR